MFVMSPIADKWLSCGVAAHRGTPKACLALLWVETPCRLVLKGHQVEANHIGVH